MGKELRVAPPVEYSLTPQPLDVAMALTNTCNHRCIFCQYHKVIPKPIKMEYGKGVRILNQARNMGIREVGFALIDEPFMSNDLELFILAAKDIGFEYVFFNTNGALAVKERMKKLFENGLNSIKFSINAGKAISYQKVHGRDDFEKVIKNICDASALRTEMDVAIGLFVSFAQNAFNEGEGKILEEILRGKVDKVYVVQAINQGGGMYEEAARNIVSAEESLWGRYKDDNRKSIIESKICPYPFKRVSVTAEGYLTACCVDAKNELIVADLERTPLAEGWNSEAMKILRTWHLEGNIPKRCKCYNCINNTNNEVLPLNELMK
jgi:wyosine [tRNA(Phe)-imidazoG37] synthetase (radical SAM superfamily)